MVTLAVHVTPRSVRDEIAGWRGDELSVRVAPAPESGRANAAVCKVIASALGVPKTSVRVIRGETSRHKVLQIGGLGTDDIQAAFGRPDEALF